MFYVMDKYRDQSQSIYLLKLLLFAKRKRLKSISIKRQKSIESRSFYRDGKEKLLIFAYRVPRFISAFFPLRGVAVTDPRGRLLHYLSSWSHRRSLPLVIGSCSTESLVIVPAAARSVLPSLLRARRGLPLRFTVFRSRAADYAGALTGHSAP